MKKLYISDLDGTLLRSDATLSEYTKHHIKTMLEHDLAFTVASARSVASIKPIFGEVALKLPVIEFNGAFISDLKTGRHQFIHAISTEVAQEIAAMASTFNIQPCVSTYDGHRDCLYLPIQKNEGIQWYLQDRLKAKDERLRDVSGHDPIQTEDVVCLTFIDRKENLDALHERIKERYFNEVNVNYVDHIYSPGWYWLTVHDKRATKDQAIRRLIQEYGMDDYELIVFGDQMNDIPMFKYANRSIAVENADPDVKRLATEIIGPNDSDSVVDFILKDQSVYNHTANGKEHKTPG